MPRLAVLSLHTSPLVQPGSGDSGGMNVYVRELVGSLAQAGVDTDVYVRRWHPELAEVVDVEPGFRVHHVEAGPPEASKDELVEFVDEFTDGVAGLIEAEAGGTTALHANYWLSGLAAHRLKHQLGIPLVSTFHTLARVKAEGGDFEPDRRARIEAEVIGCSDVVIASCTAEAAQLVELYGAERERVEVVPPGVDHAFFSPGDKDGARAALAGADGTPELALGDGPVVLFVGRIQPLKGLSVAIEAVAALADQRTKLVVVGGPSGPEGRAELARARALVEATGLGGRVSFVPPQPHHLLSTFYRAADVCLVTSRSESFGLVALEAAACGTPVVASAVGGLTTIVEDRRTGLLVEDRSPSSFARHLASVLDDPELRADMGSAAARRAKGYTWSTTAARLRRIYADVSERAPLRCA